MTQKVSIILPVYNAARYLPECIESLIKQTYEEFELIIINDGSTDSSGDVIEHYRMQDARIKVYAWQNRGLIASLNKAISVSEGAYIVRMDADDIAHEDRLAKQISYMENNPKCDVLGTSAIKIDMFGKVIGRISVPVGGKDVAAHLMINSPVIHPSVVFRRLSVDKYLYNEFDQLAEDYGLWLRLYNGENIHNLQEALLYYRIHPDSISVKRKREQYLMAAQLRKKYILDKYILCDCCMREVNIFLDLNASFSMAMFVVLRIKVKHWKHISMKYCFRWIWSALKLRKLSR